MGNANPDVCSSTLRYGEFYMETPERMMSYECRFVIELLMLRIRQWERREKLELAVEAEFDPMYCGM